MSRYFREKRKDKLRVLDYGCGTGEKLKLIKKFFPRISEYGVDFSPGAIENARKNGINAEVADIDLLNETYTNHFDVVICSQVIEHIVDHKSFVRKMGNIISRRGHLIIATPNSDSILRKLFGKYWRAYEVPRHLVVFNELSIKKLFWGLGPDLKLACSKNYYVADGVVTIGSISNLLKNYAGLRIAKANYEIKYEFLLRQVAVTLNALSYVLGRSDQNIFLLHKVGS